MEEKKSPASAAESAASGQPAAVPAAELRPGRRKFPTVGDLFAMLGIAFGAQIVVGTAAMVFLLFAGHGNALLIDLVGSRTLYVLIYIAALALSAVSGYMMLRTLRRMKEAEKNPSAA